MKRLFAGSLGIGTLVIGGIGYLWMVDPPASVIHQPISCPASKQAKARDVRVIGTHRWAKGKVILYSALCPTKKGAIQKGETPMQRVFGHQVMQRDGMNWQVSSVDSYGTENRKSTERLIEYGVSQSGQSNSQHQNHNSPHHHNSPHQRGDRYTIVYGQVLSSKVTAVEATFDTGEIFRNRVRSKTFALVAPNADRVCELRILGIDNQILRKQELDRPKLLNQPQQFVQFQPLKSNCLSTTHPL
jgi:hypothetical protein